MSQLTVEAYLAAQPEERRQALGALRDLIRRTVPAAEESMQYRMPTYTYAGHALCAMASQKHYMSLYLDVERVEAHRAEWAGLNVGKSCVRFRHLDKLPLDTVRAVLLETVARVESPIT